MTHAALGPNEWAPVLLAVSCSFFDNTPSLCSNTWQSTFTIAGHNASFNTAAQLSFSTNLAAQFPGVEPGHHSHSIPEHCRDQYRAERTSCRHAIAAAAFGSTASIASKDAAHSWQHLGRHALAAAGATVRTLATAVFATAAVYAPLVAPAELAAAVPRRHPSHACQFCIHWTEGHRSPRRDGSSHLPALDGRLCDGWPHRIIVRLVGLFAALLSSTMRDGTQGARGSPRGRSQPGRAQRRVWLVILLSFDRMASVACQTTWQSFNDPVFGPYSPPPSPSPPPTSPPPPSVTSPPFWGKGRPTTMSTHGSAPPGRQNLPTAGSSAPPGRTAVCLTGQPRALGGILGKDVFLAREACNNMKSAVWCATRIEHCHEEYVTERCRATCNDCRSALSVKHRRSATLLREMLYNLSLSSASPSTFISDMYKTNVLAPLSRSGGYDLFVIIPGNGSSAMNYEKLRPRTSNPNGKPDRMFTRLGGPEKDLPYVRTDARWHSKFDSYRTPIPKSAMKTDHPRIQSALYQLRDLEACNVMINDVVVAGGATYAFKMRLRTDLIFAAPIPPPHLLDLGTNDFPVISIGSPTFLQSNFDDFGIGHSHVMDCWFNGFSMVHHTSLLDENNSGTWTMKSYLQSRCNRAFNNISFRAESRIQPILLRHNLTVREKDKDTRLARLYCSRRSEIGEIPTPDVDDSNKENSQLDMLMMSRSCDCSEPAHNSSCTGTPRNPASTLAEVCHLYCCRYYLISTSSWKNTLHSRLTGSPPKGPGGKGAGSFPAGPCQPRQVCVGLSTCEWPEATYVPFRSGWHTSTLWGRGTPTAVNTNERCPSCGCQDAARRTLLTCEKTLISNREEDHGFGSLVSQAVVHAVGALGTGHGFQMSDMVCAIEDRGKPHCFFQPASNCGSSILMVDGLHRAHRNCALNLHRLSKDKLILNRACYRAAEVLGRNSSRRLCVSGTTLEKWRMVAKLILRVQPDIEARIQREYLADLAWSRGTYAAVHIRRTDKYKEARPRATCAYAHRLAIMCGGRCGGLDVFVATDDISVVSEFATCNRSIQHRWKTHSLEGSPPRNWGRAAVYRLYAELILMMRSEWAVATFSSNLGRLVQLMRDQPEDTMASLDANWVRKDIFGVPWIPWG